MSWTDFCAIDTISKLVKKFNIDTLIETGTFRSQNARVMSSIFSNVLTCEVNDEYYWYSVNKTLFIPNIKVMHKNSVDFLKLVSLSSNKNLFYYLDAHFYDPTLPKEEKFVVKKELKSINSNCNCIIVIHDFDTENGLGHLVYDRDSLNFDVVQSELYRINPNFVYYTNDLSTCDIVTIDDISSNKLPNLSVDNENIDSLKFVWSNPFKTYRGILYCLPTEVDSYVYNIKKRDDWSK